eukprot:5390583-Lingulodinium_polyedra.AAC.1
MSQARQGTGSMDGRVPRDVLRGGADHGEGLQWLHRGVVRHAKCHRRGLRCTGVRCSNAEVPVATCTW